MKIRNLVGGSALLLALCGCTSSLLTSEPPRSFPALEAGKGRVYFYRDSYSSASYTPQILLNGVPVGKPVRRGAFYRDVAPGSYAVTTSLISKVVNFSVAAGEKKYVRINSGLFQSQVYPELVDAAEGEAKVSRLPPM